MNKTHTIILTSDELVVLWRLTNILGGRANFDKFAKDKQYEDCFGGQYSNIEHVARKLLQRSNPIWTKLDNAARSADISMTSYACFAPKEVKLNSEYTAEIQEDGSVKVGCQTFSPKVIKELAKQVELVQISQI